MQDYYTGSSITTAVLVLLTNTRESQLFNGTPLQLLHAHTEAVAYKPTLARPSARNSHYGIGGGRCGGCEPSSGVVDELLPLLLL